MFCLPNQTFLIIYYVLFKCSSAFFLLLKNNGYNLTRSINLYINGREVRSDIASIRSELSKLTAQQVHIIRGSADNVATAGRIRELRYIINQHNHDLKYTNRLWGSFSTWSARINNFQTVIFGTMDTFKGLVAFSQDLESNMDETVCQLGKLVDIFKLESVYRVEDALLNVRSALNSLGAALTANEGYMVEFS